MTEQQQDATHRNNTITMTQRSTTCDSTDCEEPTAWDMVSIDIGDESYCSPECARSALSERDEIPSSITLHDPQLHVSRENLPDVDDDHVNITRQVTSRDDALKAVDEAAEMYPGEFRGVEDS